MFLSDAEAMQLAALLSQDVREILELGANWSPGVSEGDLNTNNPEHCRSLCEALLRYFNTGAELSLIFQGEGADRFGGIFGANEFLVKALDHLQELQAADAEDSEAACLARKLQLQPSYLRRLDQVIP